MQMESYTAEKRILNQQLGRRRANRVDACFSSLGQRRWQNSCRDMHADMFAVLRPRPLPARQSLPLSLSTFLLRYGDDRRNSDRADFVFSFERKVRRPGRPGGRVEIQIFVRRDSSDLKF